MSPGATPGATDVGPRRLTRDFQTPSAILCVALVCGMCGRRADRQFGIVRYHRVTMKCASRSIIVGTAVQSVASVILRVYVCMCATKESERRWRPGRHRATGGATVGEYLIYLLFITYGISRFLGNYVIIGYLHLRKDVRKMR